MSTSCTYGVHTTYHYISVVAVAMNSIPTQVVGSSGGTTSSITVRVYTRTPMRSNHTDNTLTWYYIVHVQFSIVGFGAV